ncbi:MAG: carboxypeptidase-like regulatory domain-containing protein [Acidobacteriota bacterium]|nr:carboxypeptidase-like regulatory domain-containing protein [Pyrinomonadaceae bacterium]MDW8305005.1 carboxypeptidase-like regulatory domain-containing protein [Acidobacteriota bacterium]
MRKAFLTFLILSCVCWLAKAQTTFSLTTSPYTQNFDGLSNTGANNTWTNGGAPPQSPGAGWQSNRITYSANNGSSNAGNLYSYGSTGSTERALGSLASSSTGTIIFGVCFTNNTGFSIYNPTISYYGEQWRRTAANNDVLLFEYQVGVNSVTASSGWTVVPQLNFTPPQAGSDSAIDGNQPENRTLLSQTINISIPPNTNFCFRWSDENSTGNDKGMAIDDFQLTFQITSAASATISGRVISKNGRGINDAFVTIAGGNLPQPITKRVTSFGYYTFEDIPVGETYIISVFSKRYTFSQPSRVINLQEDLQGVDFVADDR